MEVHTLETRPANAEAALSTPKEIDLVSLVSGIAKRKSEIGQTFNGRKGRNYLFALVCAAVKSARGMAKESHLDSSEVKDIENAIADFWKLHADAILTYGTVVSASYDKPSLNFNKAGGVESVTLNARLHAVRDPKDIAEARLHLEYCLKTARKRLEYMMEHLAEYNREVIADARGRVEAIERKLVELRA